MNKTIILIVLLALVVRTVIVNWSLQFRENTDVLRYKDWTRIAYLYGFSDTYSPKHLTFGTLPNNQPPGSLYILSAVYNSQIIFSKLILRITHVKPGSNMWINGPLVSIFLRIPSILADLGIGIIIYQIVKKHLREKAAIAASCFYLFNPVVIYNSAFWGQMDSINNFFFIFSLYFLLENKYFFSILFLFFSFYIKSSLLPLLPLFTLIIYKKISTKKYKLFLYYLGVILIIAALTLPISHSPILWLWNSYKQNGSGEMTYITNFAFNLWWMIFKPHILIGKPNSLFNFSEIRLINSPFDSKSFFYLPLFVWGILIFIIFSMPYYFNLIAKKVKNLNSKKIISHFAVGTILIFLLLPRIHERYLYPAFPLLSMLAITKKNYLLVLFLLSIFNSINIYLVWHPFFSPSLPYNLMNDLYFQWIVSICTVLTSLYFYIYTLMAINYIP